MRARRLDVLSTPTLLLIALCGATIVGCGSVPPKASPDDPAGNFAYVSQGIMRGGRPDQVGVARLADMGAKTIINLEDDDDVVELEKQWAESLRLSFVSHPMSGLSTPNDDGVNDVLAILADETRRPVYVHCMQGKDRTGIVIALHRVFNEGWSPRAAWDEMYAHGFNNILIALKHYFEKKTGFDSYNNASCVY
jgi:protein tyrosine/serine phosphatase